MGGGGGDWKSTVSDTAKLILRSVRDSADVFPPLKSVVGGLCFILENYEVCHLPHITRTILRIVPASTGEQGRD